MSEEKFPVGVTKNILIQNLNRERKTLSPFACQSRKAVRLVQEEVSDRVNIRPAFFHDTDRIIHSKAYTRYIDKTQVFSMFENDHVTHRVLHVQFVAKIARVIARCLRLNEDLVEAIALGHDLGHVPFGHDGEKVLNRICKDEKIGVFCHSAQSVKFLHEIEHNAKGLNLSLQVLDGILCHNGEMLEPAYSPDPDKNWKRFLDDYHRCFEEEHYYKKLRPMTLEGCLVRISDIIAYIGRDIEDAITVGLIDRGSIPGSITQVLGDTNRAIIDGLVTDLISNSYGKNCLMFSHEKYDALNALKNFNYTNIYHNEKIKTEEWKIGKLFIDLYYKYLDDFIQKKEDSAICKDFLNDEGREYLQNNDPKRVVVDFISGMTDDYLINQYKENFLPKKFGYSL